MPKLRDLYSRYRTSSGLCLLFVSFSVVVLIGGAFLSCLSNCVLQEISQADEIAIYSEVVRRIFTVDDTFGGAFQPRTLYIVRIIDDAAGDSSLAEHVHSAISQSLTDLPTQIVWVDTFEEVELDAQTGEVVDHGAIIRLGQIDLQPNGTVHVQGSIHVANLAAGGRTYVLTRIAGKWIITGTTGMQWMS